jgi:hypothetical protein
LGLTVKSAFAPQQHPAGSISHFIIFGRALWSFPFNFDKNLPPLNLKIYGWVLLQTHYGSDAVPAGCDSD